MNPAHDQLVTFSSLQTILREQNQLLQQQNLRNDQNLAQFVEDRKEFHGQEVLESRKPFYQQLGDMPVEYRSRQVWIKKLRTLAKNSQGSGVRIVYDKQQILCNTFMDAPGIPQQLRNFHGSIIAPFALVFESTRDLARLQMKSQQGIVCTVPIPDDVWMKLSRFVYTCLYIKMPDSLQNRTVTVAENDGVALLQKLRTQDDNIAREEIDYHRTAMKDFSVTDLGDFPAKQDEFMGIILEWDAARRDGLISERQTLDDSDKKKQFCEKFSSVLPELHRFRWAPDHKNA